MTSREGMLMGLVAVHGGLMTVEQLRDCIQKQKSLAHQNRILTLEEVTVLERALTPSQAHRIKLHIAARSMKCDRCGELHHLKDLARGSKFRCRKCRTMLSVPKGPRDLEVEAQSLAKSLFGIRRVLAEVVQEMLKGCVEPGQIIGGYRIEAMIGQGGMGEVYRATQVALHREVAMKILAFQLTARADYVDRFEREARAAARLKHQNIVQVYDVGEEHGVFYIAMEYVQGKTVQDLLKMKGPLPAKIALEIGQGVAQALQCAYEYRIVHRDIKPDNIMITAGDHHVKLMDMGLAKHLDDVSDQYTRTTEVLGTPHYMSPEQCRNDPSLDCRSDIFSLGTTLFHIITGKLPFQGTNPVDVLMQVMNKPLPAPATLGVDVPGPVFTVIKKMMHKDPSQRYQTPMELIAAFQELEVILSEPPPERAMPLPIETRPARRTRRQHTSRKILLRVAVVMGGLLFAFAVGMFYAKLQTS